MTITNIYLKMDIIKGINDIITCSKNIPSKNNGVTICILLNGEGF